MYNANDTIYALATVRGRAGVAVVRVSGEKVRQVCDIICPRKTLPPRKMVNACLYDKDGEIIDNSLTVFFESPHSFTGEDVVEFHVHGSLAIIKKLYRCLGEIKGVRLAERGEFSRRAVMNCKMDLTEAEGLLDLINAETEFQRKIALRQYSGEQRKIFDGWHDDIVKALAYMEAYLDFPEEEIDGNVEETIQSLIIRLSASISEMLEKSSKGEAIRNGYQIAILGKPNSGKSSLLNAIMKRDVAIVSDIEGTTRDVIEAYIDMDGYPVIFLDTAGIREANDVIEAEGVKRALAAADKADLILLLTAADDKGGIVLPGNEDDDRIIKVTTKADLLSENTDVTGLKISVKMDGTIEKLKKIIVEKISHDLFSLNDSLLTHERHRQCLKSCLENLFRARNNSVLPLKAEDIRLAARDLAQITGAITTDDLLDVIFGDFCIGK